MLGNDPVGSLVFEVILKGSFICFSNKKFLSVTDIFIFQVTMK